jgi:hypothetical protein
VSVALCVCHDYDRKTAVCNPSQIRRLPTAEEVEARVETVIRLWDDSEEYQRASHSARQHAQQWLPERLGPVYCDFFSGLLARAGPPVSHSVPGC